MPPIATLVILRLQVPVFEIGKGLGVEQAPMLWITVGGKARSGGTSIKGVGVFAVTTSVVGLLGSSLVITKSQDFSPIEVGVKRITKSRHESGLTVLGKGLLMRVKSGQAGSKAAPVT